MVYVERLITGIARVYYEEPAQYDFCFEEIPDGDGILMVTEDGALYFESGLSEFSEKPSVTDHEILMTLLGVTE